MNRFEIFDFKHAVTVKTGLGVCQRSWEISLDRARMTSYCCFIVTMALSRVISQILNVEKYGDLVIPVNGQSKSLRVVPFDRLYMVSY